MRLTATKTAIAVDPYWWHGHLQPVRTINEVAQMLNMNPKTVASHESTALTKLRRALRMIEQHAPHGYSMGRSRHVSW